VQRNDLKDQREEATRVEVADAIQLVLMITLLRLPSCSVPVGCDHDPPQGVQ